MAERRMFSKSIVLSGPFIRLAEVMCYALEHGIRTDVIGCYNHYNDLGWQEGGSPLYDWRRKHKHWEEDYAGTP